MSAAATPARRGRNAGHVEAWSGGYRRYDLAKEFVVALLVVTLLTVMLSALFSSPDDPPVTIARWSRAAPADFVTAAVTELAGTSEVAEYGPPYTTTPDAAQKVAPVCLQCIPGVRIPVNTAQEFVLGPLAASAAGDPALASAIAQWKGASGSQQQAWASAYGDALSKATIRNGTVTVPAGEYGPVPVLMQRLLTMARDGGLDGALLATRQFYQTDYTKPILFISGGSYFEDQASARHLLGEQWGMMNETGNWPGQAWLWLYTFWYQVPPWSQSGNADAEVWVIMMILTAVLVFVPLIPGVRAIPKKLRVYRLIWRSYYRQVEGAREPDRR
jgi:hypothetical protein